MSITTWLKHHAWLASPGNEMMRFPSSSIIVSLGDVLSHVMHRICKIQVSIFSNVLSLKLTLSETLNSWRMSANAAARLTPECDIATSTILRIMHIGTPLFSKWTVTAMNALWFGDVHTSVAKLSALSCSCSIFAMCLCVFAKTFLTSCETVVGEGM